MTKLLPEDHVLLHRELTSAVSYAGTDFQYDYDDEDPVAKAFLAEFEVVGNRQLGNPKPDYYQGLEFTAVIRRKSDGKLYGYDYWEDISKHGEAYVEDNSWEFGLENGVLSVWLPVEAFTITGYKTIDTEEAPNAE
jgi:hypothetical protein